MTTTPPDDDSVPSFLKLTHEQRRAAWERNPPKPMPAFSTHARTSAEEEATRAIREELATKKRTKTKNRIDKMLTRKSDKDHARAGERWDTRRNKWVSDAHP